MKIGTLKTIEAFSKRLNHFFVATSSGSGDQHMACVKDLEVLSQQSVSVKAWFCPVSLANLEENRSITIVAYDPDKDIGYQLVGELLRVNGVAMLDTERRLIIQVDKVMEFIRTAHNDKEV